MALNLRQGDEVICCSHTMLATASAIKVAGGIPIPVEIGYDNLIDPDAVETQLHHVLSDNAHTTKWPHL